jgi:N-acetylglucosamine malate deacetylase 1
MEFTPILQTLSSLFPSKPLTQKLPCSYTVMILSPHPDDESITGSLALRLALENNAHLINVAVTLGSNKDRQAERLHELTEACQLLEMELILLDDDWKKKAKELKSLIQKYQPQLILAPHLKDHHPTHIKTGELLKKVLLSLKKSSALIAWTEFWGAMKKPNLMVEIPKEIVELQMRALEKHVGEIKRNPYHLRLPAWMMDNVRRGSEIIATKGAPAADMAFAVIYQLELFKEGKFKKVKLPSPFIKTNDDAAYIFQSILDAAAGSKTKVK